MQFHHLDRMTARQRRALYAELDGTLPWIERIRRGGTGSPVLFYSRGWDYLDDLQNRCTDEIRMNFEALRSGFFLRVAERTNTYLTILPYSLPVRLNPMVAPAESRGERREYWRLEVPGEPALEFWTRRDDKQAMQRFWQQHPARTNPD